MYHLIYFGVLWWFCHIIYTDILLDMEEYVQISKQKMPMN